ncbi:MAG: DUF5055 domain-containing protein [Eubacteriales bacterium]
MSKSISFIHNGTAYKLEFTPETVCQMEQGGFNFDTLKEAEKYPFTIACALFAGAFYANHVDLTEDEIFSVIESLARKQELLERLAEMYVDVIRSMEAGDTAWTVVETYPTTNYTTFKF